MLREREKRLPLQYFCKVKNAKNTKTVFLEELINNRGFLSFAGALGT
jgi:hypothetical protein